MAIQISGVVLPEIPADVLAEYPHAVICANVTYSTFGLGLSKEGWCYVHRDVSGFGMSILYSPDCKVYSLESDGSSWVEVAEEKPVLMLNKVAPEWCNHDIYKATAFDKSTASATIGTELYYTERQNFNGVWLPKIPDGFFDTNTYGYIIEYVTDTTIYYYLHNSSSELLHGSSDFLESLGMSDYSGSDGMVMTVGNILDKRFCAGLCGVWQETDTSLNRCPMGQVDTAYFQILWTNHDVLNVTSVNPDTGDFTTGEIYFIDSSVVYEEKYSAPGTWFKGMGDAVRAITGEQKRYTIDEIKSTVENCWMERLVVNCGPTSLASAKTEIQSDCEKFDIYPFKISNLVEKISLPNATYIGYSALSAMYVKTVEIPKVTHIGEMAFGACLVLSSVDLPVAESIGYMAFGGCQSLDTLILRKADAICQLAGVNIEGLEISGRLCDNDTLISKGTGYIYVPSALVDTYKADTNWSTYANQFRALENYTVDGTITGELDETKI